MTELEAQIAEATAKLEALQQEQKRLVDAENAKLEALKAVSRAEANKEISKLLDAARQSISHAERIADKHNLTFDWDLEYGMGGSYNPNQGWESSSSMC